MTILQLGFYGWMPYLLPTTIKQLYQANIYLTNLRFLPSTLVMYLLDGRIDVLVPV